MGAPSAQLIVPGGQGLQSWMEPAFRTSRYVWNGQGRHRLEFSGANMPRGQAVHLLAPALEKVPFGHDRHSSRPAKGVCLPGSHNAHSSRILYLPV